jgi:hypothetical protein
MRSRRAVPPAPTTATSAPRIFAAARPPSVSTPLVMRASSAEAQLAIATFLRPAPVRRWPALPTRSNRPQPCAGLLRAAATSQKTARARQRRARVTRSRRLRPCAGPLQPAVATSPRPAPAPQRLARVMHSPLMERRATTEMPALEPILVRAARAQEAIQ